MTMLALLLLAGAPYYVELREARWTEPRAESGGSSEIAGGPNPALLRPGPGAPVVRESAPVTSTQPFRELLVSWNVDAPPRTGFVVELRVGTEVDGGFSPWMHIGDWGERAFAPPLTDRVVTCPGGRVDVDWFRGERTFRSAQVRLRAFASESGAALSIRHLRLCFSDPERAVEPLPPLEPRPWGRVLDVAPRSQKVERQELASRICSPTSVAMVLRFRGADVATLEVAERAYDAAHDIYGNWPRNVQAAYSFGVPGYLTRFSDWTAVEQTVAEGTPLVLSIAVKAGQLKGAPYDSTAGHLIVLAGFDDAGDCVVNDPAVKAPDSIRRVYARADLQAVWMDRGGTAYVLEERK